MNMNKAIAMMRRKSPPSENIYFIENHCQINISKGRRGKDFNINVSLCVSNRQPGCFLKVVVVVNIVVIVPRKLR